MRDILKKTLFARRRSSLDLFLALPVLILLSAGCLCSGGGEPRSCVTADGAQLVWAGSKLKIVRLADGSVTTSEATRYADVLCPADNQIVTVKEESVRENKQSRIVRTARWPGAEKEYPLARLESFRGYLGFIRNRYFVASSRGFYERSTGGKNSRTYRVYDQPQIVTLEDSATGELKSHYFYRDKLGLPETVLYEDLWFYLLSLDEQNGVLLFAMTKKQDRTALFYRLDLFAGRIEATGTSVEMPADMEQLNDVAADRSGKFAAFVYEGKDGTAHRKLIDVLHLETGKKVVSRYFKGISFDRGTPHLVFEEKGRKLAVLTEGWKFEPTRRVQDVTAFDLTTGREIAQIDNEEFLRDPEKVSLLGVVGDEAVLAYTRKKSFGREEHHLCKVNLLTREILWDIDPSAD